jgi:CRISPR type I-E-associated protein CasB/Cse2
MLFPAGKDRYDDIDDDGQRMIGSLAILLAHVRGEGVVGQARDSAQADEDGFVNATTSARKLGEQSGRDKESGGSPKLARLRFSRMLHAQDPDNRLRAFRDLLALLGIDKQSDFDRRALAEIFLRWHQPRIQFAFARGYFAALNGGQSTPDSIEMQINPELRA